MAVNVELNTFEKVHADQNRVVLQTRLLIITATSQFVRQIALTPLIFTLPTIKR